MEDFAKFRSAIGGFNRTDVVNYIEAVSVAHQAELRKLLREIETVNKERDSLKAELAEAKALVKEAEKTAQKPAPVEEPAAEAPVAEEPAAAEAAPVEAVVVPAVEEEAPAEEAAPSVSAVTEQELEAYRRAEAAERMAIERAEKLREQMKSLCDKATEEYAGCFEKVQLSQEEAKSTFEKFQEAMRELEKTIQSTKESFESADF